MKTTANLNSGLQERFVLRCPCIHWTWLLQVNFTFSGLPQGTLPPGKPAFLTSVCCWNSRRDPQLCVGFSDAGKKYFSQLSSCLQGIITMRWTPSLLTAQPLSPLFRALAQGCPPTPWDPCLGTSQQGFQAWNRVPWVHTCVTWAISPQGSQHTGVSLSRHHCSPLASWCQPPPLDTVGGNFFKYSFNVLIVMLISLKTQ